MKSLVGEDIDIPDWLEKRRPDQLPRSEGEREQLVNWFDEVWDYQLKVHMMATQKASLAGSDDFMVEVQAQSDLLCQALVSVRTINPEITLKELAHFLQPKRKKGAPKKDPNLRMKAVAYTALLFDWIRPLLRHYYGKSPRGLAIYIACRLWNFGNWEDAGDGRGREFFPYESKLEQYLKRPDIRRPEKLIRKNDRI